MTLTRAKELATQAAHKAPGRFRLGAVLLCGNRVVRTGFNAPRPLRWVRSNARVRPLRGPNDWTCHAEMHAIHMVPRPVLRRSTLVVVRVDQRGDLRTAAPCDICREELLRHGVDKIWYTDANGVLVRL